MALPVGVSTCTVTYGSALTYLGEVSTISAALTADRSVVWSATGVSLNSGGDQLTANAGLALSFSVPHVDQTGFVNNAGDAVTNWYYTLTGVVTFATGEKMSFRKNFQVLVGQSTLDLDLIPDNATVLPAVVVDAPPVTSVAGLTGVVSAEDLGDALSATFVPIPEGGTDGQVVGRDSGDWQWYDLPVSGGGSGDATGAVVLDFRQMANGPVSTILPTQGDDSAFVAFSSNTPNSFSISNGRLICAPGADVCYPEVRCSDNVVHAWVIMEFDATVGNIEDSKSMLIGFPESPQWAGVSSSNSMGIHTALYAKYAGVSTTGRVDFGSYNSPGTTANVGSRNAAYSFVGRTVRFDVVLDRKTGHVREFVDGVLLGEYVDAVVPTFAGKTALFEFNNSGIKVLEFGASPRMPAIPQSQRSSINGFHSVTTLSASYQKIYDVIVVYPPSGMIEVSWEPFVTCQEGSVYMDLGSSSAVDGVTYKRRLCTGAIGDTSRGVFLFRRTRTGTPGTREAIGIWSMTDGVAKLESNDYGGEGPMWREVHPPTAF